MTTFARAQTITNELREEARRAGSALIAMIHLLPESEQPAARAAAELAIRLRDDTPGKDRPPMPRGTFAHQEEMLVEARALGPGTVWSMPSASLCHALTHEGIVKALRIALDCRLPSAGPWAASCGALNAYMAISGTITAQGLLRPFGGSDVWDRDAQTTWGTIAARALIDAKTVIDIADALELEW